MADPPAIGVVIPCYNQGSTLDEAVRSVFAQTRGDFEIVIVDDGSTDPETRRLLADYRRPRTRVVRTENRGLPAARNAGIRRAANPYVCALDADDRLAPTWFEKALEVLEDDPSVSFVSHWLRTFGDQEWEWTPERCDLAALLDMNTVNGAAVVRRADLEAVGLYDETWRDGCEDWDLWLRMVERGFRGVILPEVLFHYRRRQGSMSREMTRPRRQLELFRRLIDHHAESYRRHLLDLLQRRETNLCDLRGEIYDLEHEDRDWWQPELERRRAEVETLRRKVEEVRRRKEEEAERRRLGLDLEGHRQALADAEAEIAELRRIQGEHVDERAHLEADLEGHRQSLANAEAEIAGLRRIQDQHVDERVHLEADLEGHWQSLANAEEEIAELRRIQDQHVDERAHLEADLEGHRQSLANAEEEIGELRRIQGEHVDGRAHLEADLEGHRRSLHHAHLEIETWRRQAAALRRSRSWRWTAPIRAATGWIRKLGKGRS